MTSVDERREEGGWGEGGGLTDLPSRKQSGEPELQGAKPKTLP